MEIILLIRLTLVVLLMFTTSCTAATPLVSAPPAASMSAGHPQQFEPPKWVKSPTAKVIDASDYQAAGWDGGFLLATDNQSEGAKVLTSKDGHDWRVTAPAGMVELKSGLSAQGRVAAGYGTAGYLLGWSSQGFTVWRTEDGERWESLPLDIGDLDIGSRSDLDLTITAGPHGVLVVGRDAYYPHRYNGTYVWHSPDGRSFGTMTSVPEPAEKSPYGVDAAATPSGFLISMNGEKAAVLLSSEDGGHWLEIAGELAWTRMFGRVCSNGSVVVGFEFYQRPGQVPGDGELRPWYRHGGTWSPATLDPGRLPDAGVVPANERRINVVRNWGTGFIAIGNTFGGDGREVAGLVWYSAAGSTWTRMSVRENGFDSASELMDIAVSRQKAVLVGFSSDDSHQLVMWQADAPPLPGR